MKKLKFINRIIFILNNGAAILLLCSLLAPRIKPASFSLIAVLGLLTPSLIVLNTLFVLYWVLIGFKRQWLLSALILLVCSFMLPPVYKFSSSNFPETKEPLSIMTYNVRKFNLYNWIKDDSIPNKIGQFITDKSPDVVVLQEYKYDKDFILDYPYQFTPESKNKESVGYAFFSKYPIASSGDVDYYPQFGKAFYIDILTERDTLRIINFHLHSLGIIAEQDYFGHADSEKLLGRIKKSLILQELQVKRIRRLIDSTRHKVILAGDLNNTAYSWSYKQLRRELKDSYLETGSSFGRTYEFQGFPLRIDYLFVDPELTIDAHQNFDQKFSDHYPILIKVSL